MPAVKASRRTGGRSGPSSATASPGWLTQAVGNLKRALAPNKQFQRMASLPWAAAELWRQVVTTNIVGYIDHSRSPLYRVSLSARFASTISASGTPARFIFTRKGWGQLWLLRARPMVARALTGRGTRVVYDKEGIAPCKCRAVSCTAAHYCECVYQRRRKRPAPRLRGVARRTGATRTDRPGRSGDRLHNRTGEDACPRHRDRLPTRT